MSQLPDKIYLHKDEKYNTGDYLIAYRRVHLEIKSVDEDVDMNDYVGYIRKDLVEHIIRGALGPQDALMKLRSLE